MFRCKDCGQEYEIKPDYCDCGNDVFEEITPPPQPEQVASKIAQQSALRLNSQSDVTENSTPAPLPAFSKRKQTKSGVKIDLASLMIFFICIVLSVLSVIYIGKDSLEKLAQEENQPRDTKALLTPTANLPTINSIWNSTPPPVTEEPVKTVTAETEPVAVMPVQPVTQPAAKPQKTATPAPVKKVQNQTQKVQTIPKPQPAKITQQAANTSQPVKPVQTTPKPAQQTATKAQTPVQTVQPVQTVSPAVLKQEMDNYKIALGRRLSSGIDYARIVGDGVCAVSFKLDASGNLINRRFVTKSEDNDSLNNAVYKTMMNHPTYQSPPAGYKNETLTFTVSIYGGRFNVSLN